MVIPEDHAVLGLGAFVQPDRDHLLLIGDEDCEAMLEECRVPAPHGVTQLPHILLAKAVEVGAFVTCGN